MANIPGATNALPGVFTDVITQSRGVNVPGGLRVAALIGEGSATETIVASANGGGQDGLNATYTSTKGSDGRHFQFQNFPLITNRTQIFKNGIPLTGIEGTITPTTTFSNAFNYMLDITQGRLLLQSAHLQDQGGTFYVPLNTNVGQGVLNGLQLIDANAPPETWTVRCIKVQRNNLNQPIAGTASFLAIGSVTGAVLDANANPIVWIANNQTVSNGILSFSIQESQSGNVVISPFREGDAFTIIVASGVLVKGDSITSTEIPVANLNIPTLVNGMGQVVNLFGLPSAPSIGSNSNGNNLSLGAQLAFANNAPSLLCVQAAPPLPRRTSYILDPSVNALSTNDNDFIFPLPVGVVPNFNSDIHFFVQNNTTLVESQLLPNKFAYYSLGTSGQPTLDQFVNSNAPAPGGFSYFYSVIQSFEDIATGFDGYIGRSSAFNTRAVFHSSIVFDATYVGKLLKVIDSNNKANVGTFNITAVSGGQLSIQTVTTGEPGDLIPFPSPSGFPDFVSHTPETFELIYIPTGLPAVGGSGTDGTLVAFLNTATATLTSSSVNFGPFGAPPQPLGFGILAAAGITNTGTSSVNGDVGTYPTTSETGFGTLTIGGTNHAGDSVTQAAMLALNAQYLAAAALGAGTTKPTDLVGQVLTPGVYSSLSGTFANSGTITFNGHGAYTMQMSSTLITSTSSNMVLINGALASDITWVVGSSATLGISSHLVGSVLANTSITANTGATVNGRLLAGAVISSGAVTLDTNTITVPATGGSGDLLGFYRLQINGSSVGNNGLYDIIGYNSGTNTLTLQMSFVSESPVRYEVLDPTLQSNYVVVNRNIVPNGNQLRVTIVDARDASFFDAGWENALLAMTKVECDILVPLPAQTISVIFQNALSHCLSMSNIRNKKERVLFIGAISGLTADNLSGNTLAAVEDIGILEGIQGETVTDILSGNIEDLANYSVPNAFGNTFRCVYFYPDQIVVQAGTNNILTDGFYLAAAAAGYEAADTIIQNPLTNKTLSGFTILRNKQFSTATLEQLASAGVTTLQPVAGGGRVVWGLTTSQSGFVEEQEISIVFIRDRVAKNLRAGFSGFIGNPQTEDTSTILNTRAVIILNALVSQGLITAYAGLSVAQDDVDPTQWDITVNVQPTYPVNFIYIKVNLGKL
jgi:hypothetical protein